jgi:histidyl-tRNA synthetase
MQRCKGFRDLSPEEMAKFRFVEAAFRDRCLRWGYREVRTPTLEYLYLFTSAGTLTPGMLRRVYSFLDWDGWSGERVVLRPDNTIPVARFYIDSLAEKGSARLFYVAPIFMFEETGKKSRERWQCGVELIGENSVTADAELVALALDALQGLGFDKVELRLSHAGLVRQLLARLELTPGEQDRVLHQILDGDVGALARIKPDKPELLEALTLLLGLKGKSSGFLKNIKALFSQNLPELEPSLDSFIGVVDLLEELGCRYRIDLASGKGYEYYTGIIFHLSIGGETVGGGGRYDALIPMMGGKETPAAGFALYPDRLMSRIGLDAKPKARRILLRLAPGVAADGFSIASQLREAGFTVELGWGEPGHDWLLELQDKKPMFTLTDRTSGKKTVADTAAGALALLGRDGKIA